MNCPLCNKPLDNQGTTHTKTHVVHVCYCHACLAFVRIEKRRTNPTPDHEEKT